MKEENNLITLNYRFSRLILKKGKLFKVDNLLDNVYLLLSKELGEEPINILNKAIYNIMPIFLLEQKKIGKKVVVRPFFISSDYLRESLGMKWIIDSALKKKGDFVTNLYLEILDAFYDKGITKKKQQDIYEIVLNNKKNIKYRW